MILKRIKDGKLFKVLKHVGGYWYLLKEWKTSKPGFQQPWHAIEQQYVVVKYDKDGL